MNADDAGAVFPDQFEKDQVGPVDVVGDEVQRSTEGVVDDGKHGGGVEEGKFGGGAVETWEEGEGEGEQGGVKVGGDGEEEKHEEVQNEEEKDEGERKTESEKQTESEKEKETETVADDQPVQKGLSNTELQPLSLVSDISNGPHALSSDAAEETAPEVNMNGDTQASPETAELQPVSLEEGEFGYHPGRESEPGEETGENPQASRTRRRLSQGEPLCHSAPKQPAVKKQAPRTGLTAETAELRKISLRKGEFGYNPGKEGEPGEDTGENPKASLTRRRLSHTGPPRHNIPKQPAPAKQIPKTGSAVGTIETAELRRVSLTQGDFGYNPGAESEPGEDTGENPEAARTRRRLSHSEPPHHSPPKQPAPNSQIIDSPETREPQQLSTGNDELGCNTDNEPLPGHPKRKHSDTSDETKELESNRIHRKDIGPKATAERRELRHVGLGRGETGYNVGKVDGRHRQESGESSRAKLMFGRSRTDPGAEELSHIDVREGDFGYNVGKGRNPGEEAGENPEASQARRRFSSDQPHHSAKSTQTLETQELAQIHLSRRDIGPQQTQASPETRELRQIDLRSGEFGYNVGRGEEAGHIRPDADSSENPNAGRARRRASIHLDGDYGEERPNFGYRNPPGRRRSSQELGINPVVREQSHIEPPFQDNAPRSERDTLVNDTLQTYLEDFLSDRDSGKASEHPKVRSSQTMEGVSQQPVSNDHADEHRQKTPSSSKAPPAATLEELQLLLGQFKRDIIISINPRAAPDSDGDEKQFVRPISQFGPRLRRIETDVDFIRKQISIVNNSGSGVSDGVLSQERSNSMPNRGAATRSTIASMYRRGKSDINWGVVSLGILAALGLVAFGEMLGSSRYAGKGLGDRLAEWLFMEGRGQKVSGN